MRLCSPYKSSMSNGERGGDSEDREVYEDGATHGLPSENLVKSDVYHDHNLDEEKPSAARVAESESDEPSHRDVNQANSPAHLRYDSQQPSASPSGYHQPNRSSFDGLQAASHPENPESEGTRNADANAAATAAALARQILHRVSSEGLPTHEQGGVGELSATSLANPVYHALQLAHLSHLQCPDHFAAGQPSSTPTNTTFHDQGNQVTSSVSNLPLQQLDRNAAVPEGKNNESPQLGVESTALTQIQQQGDGPRQPAPLLAPAEPKHRQAELTHEGTLQNVVVAASHLMDGYQQSGDSGHLTGSSSSHEVPRPRSNSVPANPVQVATVLAHEAHNTVVLRAPAGPIATEKLGEALNDGSALLASPPGQTGANVAAHTVALSTPLSKPATALRRGKWTPEEEAYVARVIQDFNSGYLNAPAGTTLRTYLSDKLNCDPMRITKKFTGDACIGKRVFHPAVRCATNAAAIDKAQAELDALERRWRRRLELQQRESAKKAANSSSATASARSPQNRQHPNPQEIVHQHVQVPKQRLEQQQVQVHHVLVPQHVQPQIHPPEIAAAPAPVAPVNASSVALLAAPPAAISAIGPALIAPATGDRSETRTNTGAVGAQGTGNSAETALLDDSVVTRTATWLDQANAILSSKDVTVENFQTLFTASQGPSGISAHHNQQPLLLPAAVTTPAADGSVATAPADVETQMKEVRRLIHEGPFIMEQASTAGLSSKLLLGQSIRAPDLAESARPSSTGALGSKPSMLSTGRGPNEQPPASIANGLGASSGHSSDILRPGKRKLTGEVVSGSPPENQASTSVFAATNDRTALFSLATEGLAADVQRGQTVIAPTTSELQQQMSTVASGLVQQVPTDHQATAALHSLQQQQQEYLPRRAFSANQLSSMSSRGTSDSSSGGCAMQDTTAEDAAQALVGFLNSVRAESFRASAAADASSNGPAHAATSAAGTRIHEEE